MPMESARISLAPRTAFASRVQKLRRAIVKSGFGGVVMAPGPNIRYFTGVQSQILERPFMLFVPAEGDPHLVAPNLESGPYSRSPVSITLHMWDDAGGPSASFAELRRAVDLKGEWGCEGRVPYAYLRQIEDPGLKLEPADSMLERIRETKDEAELAEVRKAAEILGKAYLKVPQLMRAGMTESQLATALREEAFSLGAEVVDFCSVQAGAHAADPHWSPSATKIRDGEVVLIDSCCTKAGYYADITRTFVVGRNAKVEKAYGQVLEAQTAALESVRAGAKVGDVDAAARSSLESASMGRYFYHRTGHGLGLDVHEKPYIVPGGEERLRAGMVFTVEPGVYIEGDYGVRIEDDVIVGHGRVEVPTAIVPKEYGWWK